MDGQLQMRPARPDDYDPPMTPPAGERVIEDRLRDADQHITGSRVVPSQPRARTTDPDTSHAAARSVQEPSTVQKAILFILREIHTWGASDYVIAQTYKLRQESMGQGVYPPCSESGLRTRRAELVDRGLVRDSGKRMNLPSGRSAIIWEAT